MLIVSSRFDESWRELGFHPQNKLIRIYVSYKQSHGSSVRYNYYDIGRSFGRAVCISYMMTRLLGNTSATTWNPYAPVSLCYRRTAPEKTFASHELPFSLYSSLVTWTAFNAAGFAAR